MDKHFSRKNELHRPNHFQRFNKLKPIKQLLKSNEVISELINLYSIITKDCPINKLGSPYSYYHSEETKSNLLGMDLIEIDITSAFPSIIKLWFGEKDNFVKKIYSIEDKKERNIFISTTITEWNKNGKNDITIKDLNLLCKILTLGNVYSLYKNIIIFEYKKDGILFKGEIKNSKTNEEVKFLEIINRYIKFHISNIRLYLRFNLTSIYRIDKIDIKGRYKNLPIFLNDIIYQLCHGEIHNKQLLEEIKKIYSDLYFNILFKTGQREFINKYYCFENKSFLDYNGKVQDDISKISPQAYLRFIIYPILTLLKLNKEK